MSIQNSKSSDADLPSDKLNEDKATSEQNKTSFLDYTSDYQLELQSKIPSLKILILILFLQLAFSNLPADAFIPAINKISSDFSISADQVQSFIAFFFIGGGIGQFVWGPLSDHYGRTKTLFASAILGGLFNLIFAITTNYDLALMARLVEGFALSGVSILATIVVKDIYCPRKFFIYNAILITFFMFVPALAPILGGYIYISLGWRYIFYFITFGLIIAVLLNIKNIPETLNPDHKQSLHIKAIASNFLTILKSGESNLLILINIVFSIAIFNLPTLLPQVFINIYHVEPEHFGYYTLALVLFVMVGLQLNQLLIGKKISPVKIVVVSSIIQFLLLSVNFAVAFELFGLKLGIISIMIPLSLNVVFNGLQLGNIFGFYLMAYPKFTGTASSLVIGLRLIIPGIVVNMLGYIPAYGGRTILLINAISLIITFISIMFYYIHYTKCGKAFDGRRN